MHQSFHRTNNAIKVYKLLIYTQVNNQEQNCCHYIDLEEKKANSIVSLVKICHQFKTAALIIFFHDYTFSLRLSFSSSYHQLPLTAGSRNKADKLLCSLPNRKKRQTEVRVSKWFVNAVEPKESFIME